MQRAGVYVREAMERNAVDDALRHAAVMLGELRTELLPSAYYSLWTQACGELAALGAFFEACDDYQYDHLSLVRFDDLDRCRSLSIAVDRCRSLSIAVDRCRAGRMLARFVFLTLGCLRVV